MSTARNEWSLISYQVHMGGCTVMTNMETDRLLTILDKSFYCLCIPAMRRLEEGETNKRKGGCWKTAREVVIISLWSVRNICYQISDMWMMSLIPWDWKKPNHRTKGFSLHALKIIFIAGQYISYISYYWMWIFTLASTSWYHCTCNPCSFSGLSKELMMTKVGRHKWNNNAFDASKHSIYV